MATEISPMSSRRWEAASGSRSGVVVFMCATYCRKVVANIRLQSQSRLGPAPATNQLEVADCVALRVRAGRRTMVSPLPSLTTLCDYLPQHLSLRRNVGDCGNPARSSDGSLRRLSVSANELSRCHCEPGLAGV